jgi:ATP-dependent helicase/nuclease subunit A
MEPSLADDLERTRIKDEIDQSLFVQAGAGSGKTTQIVKRITSLVKHGIPISRIVAITFTEKAAADLRNRVRKSLENAEAEANGNNYFAAALDELDAAPLGTIHSFARRLIAENPIEVGVPPGFEVRSDLASKIDQTAVWASQRELIFQDPDLRADFDLLIGLGVTMKKFEELATVLDTAWDRLPEGVRDAPDDGLGISAFIESANQLVSFINSCSNESDRLFLRLRGLEQYLHTLETIKGHGPLEIALHLKEVPRFAKNLGAKPNWPNGDLTQVREMGIALLEQAQDVFDSLIQPSISRITRYFADIALDRAIARRRAGALDFHDLLVIARNLINSSEETWGLIARRYHCVILDEFQDTDPLQAELLCRLVGESFEPETHWSQLSLRPGGLTTVGDPKQSIYRFRGADIDTYFRHRTREPAISDSPQVELSTNFRSSVPVVEWINEAFDSIIVQDGRIQPEFQPLTPGPGASVAGALEGPSIGVIGDGIRSGKADEARRDEAKDIAAAIVRATGRVPGEPRWTIQRRLGQETEIAAAELSDICILIPTRRSLPDIESALRAADIEFISEASSIVYSTLEVQGLLLAARAVAHTADPGALVLALRSPLFGVGDDDLLAWQRDNGPWNVFSDMVFAESPHPVGRALHILKNIVSQLPSLTPSDVLDVLVRESMLYEKFLAVGAGQKAWWRRIRYVVDQAEAWYSTTGGSLRDYLVWAELQQDESTKVREAIAPEIGDNAVRITTVHMSKGLEYPIVILGGAMSAQTVKRPIAIWDDRGSLFVHLASGVKDIFSIHTLGYEDAFATERVAQLAEHRRLLYVACTRAESHLVVSQHRHTRSQEHAFGSVLAATEAVTMSHATALVLDDGDVDEAPPAQLTQSIVTTPPDEWEQWHLSIQASAAIARGRSVTELAHNPSLPGAEEFFASLGLTSPEAVPVTDTDDSPDNEDDAPLGEKKKRVMFREIGEEVAPKENTPVHHTDSMEPVPSESGSSFGQALHWVMEMSDLNPQADITSLSRRASETFGIARPELAEAAANKALVTDVVVEARLRPHWLELPLLIPVGDLVVEGFADLVYEKEDGSLVVVDFKTDRVLDPKTLDAYWAQLSSYAAILHRVTGKPAGTCVIVHAPVEGEASVVVKDKPTKVVVTGP